MNDQNASIQPFEYTDEVTGDKISISISPHYSKLCINKREYFFVRETGEFDGTGECLIDGPYLVSSI